MPTCTVCCFASPAFLICILPARCLISRVLSSCFFLSFPAAEIRAADTHHFRARRIFVSSSAVLSHADRPTCTLSFPLPAPGEGHLGLPARNQGKKKKEKKRAQEEQRPSIYHVPCANQQARHATSSAPSPWRPSSTARASAAPAPSCPPCSRVPRGPPLPTSWRGTSS